MVLTATALPTPSCTFAAGFVRHRQGLATGRPASLPQQLPARCGVRRWAHVRGVVLAAGRGGGVLDRPTTTGLPGIDLGKSVTKQRPRFYRVMLHNDDFNRREYVVKVLLKVLDNFTMEDAINCMQEAHTNGVACLVSCPQEDAERYCEGLRLNGLISTIEPAGSSGGGNGNGPEAS